MGKILVAAVGFVLALGTLLLAIGMPIAVAVVAILGLSMLGRRDFVPVIYNLRSLAVRKVSTGLTALGLALVVFVFATVLMLAQGIKKTLVSTGEAENAKVLRSGAQSEVQSGVQPEQARIVSASPEVAIDPQGQPIVSAESVVLIFAQRENPKSEQDGANVTVRGVGPKALEVHKVAHVSDGRMVAPGTSEVLVGRALIGRFQGFRLGASVHFARRDWKVVGILDADGSGFESELWGDIDQVADAMQRRGGYSSLAVRLKDPSMLTALQARLGADRQLSELTAKRERDYYAEQSEGFALFIKVLGIFVAVIFAFGAALGAMITMYSQVAARTREIGTLRALGFRRRAVLVSFVLESVILSLLAGGVGVAAASLMQLASFSTMNFQSFSEISFHFTMNPGVIASALGFAGVMGFAGGVLPATRAARMGIVDATRGG